MKNTQKPDYTVSHPIISQDFSATEYQIRTGGCLKIRKFCGRHIWMVPRIEHDKITRNDRMEIV